MKILHHQVGVGVQIPHVLLEVNPHLSLQHLFIVHSLLSCDCVLFVLESHKAEAPALVGVGILHDSGVDDVAKDAELGKKSQLIHLRMQVADVQTIFIVRHQGIDYVLGSRINWVGSERHGEGRPGSS